MTIVAAYQHEVLQFTDIKEETTDSHSRANVHTRFYEP